VTGLFQSLNKKLSSLPAAAEVPAAAGTKRLDPFLDWVVLVARLGAPNSALFLLEANALVFFIYGVLPLGQCTLR
jgi:hypothetical protein